MAKSRLPSVPYELYHVPPSLETLEQVWHIEALNLGYIIPKARVPRLPFEALPLIRSYDPVKDNLEEVWQGLEAMRASPALGRIHPVIDRRSRTARIAPHLGTGDRAVHYIPAGNFTDLYAPPLAKLSWIMSFLAFGNWPPSRRVDSRVSPDYARRATRIETGLLDPPIGRYSGPFYAYPPMRPSDLLVFGYRDIRKDVSYADRLAILHALRAVLPLDDQAAAWPLEKVFKTVAMLNQDQSPEMVAFHIGCITTRSNLAYQENWKKGVPSHVYQTVDGRMFLSSKWRPPRERYTPLALDPGEQVLPKNVVR